MSDQAGGLSFSREPAGQRRALAAMGVIALAAWLLWWAVSFQRDGLQAEGFWHPLVFRHFGTDFKANYLASRMWLDGQSPYDSWAGHEVLIEYGYPPPMLWFFTWCAWFEFEQARVIWFGVLTAITAAATWYCCRWRRAAGCAPIPLPAALAAILFTTPLLFALERGQCDHLVVLLILAAALCLRRQGAVADVSAGGFLALAAALKLYPGLLLLALIAMRRWRALAAFGAVGILIAVTQWDFVLASQQRLEELAARRGYRQARPLAHSITAPWEMMFRGIPGLQRVRSVPGWLAGAVILGPLIAAVTWRLGRLRGPHTWALPYLLWLAAAATFVPTVAMDYNLIFLPLALVAVWQRRDPLAIQLMLGLSLLWLQPFALPIDARLLLAIKVVALYAVGWCLVRRAEEMAAVPRAWPALAPALEPARAA